MSNKQFAVIGLGRFGFSLVKELVALGHEVLAVDISADRIHQIMDYATHAVEADAMDETVIKALGMSNFDVVVVSIGDMQSNILTTIILKEMGITSIVAKAKSELHGRVLERLGADLVVYPERDMAAKIANSLSSNSIMEYIEVSPHYSLVELHTPKQFLNKTLTESNIRHKYNISILAIRRKTDFIVSPQANEIILPGDDLVVLGRNEDIKRFSRLE